MTPVLGKGHTGLTARSRLALIAYLALFFVLLLPAHDLLHTTAGLTDRDRLEQFPSHPTTLGHNADHCQLCRTHGQLDAYAVPVQGLAYLPATTRIAGESIHEPISSLPSHLSPRAPPAVG